MLYACLSLAWAHNWLSVILLGVNFGWAPDPCGFCGNSWLIMGMWWDLFPGDTPKVCITNKMRKMPWILLDLSVAATKQAHFLRFASDIIWPVCRFCSAISISSLQNWSLGNGATCFVPCHPIKTLFLANTSLKFDLLSWFNFSAFTLVASSGPRNRVAPTH